MQFRSTGVYLFLLVAHAMFSPRGVLGAPLLGIDPGSTLYDVDTQTGSAGNPRDTGVQLQSFTGIALSPGGTLYALGDAEFLYSIDPATAGSVQVGGVPLPFGEGDIDFDPVSGSLYGVGFSAGLVIIDTANGDAQVVGGLAGVVDASAMAFDDTGALWVIDTATDELLEVDKANGDVLGSVALSVALGEAAGMDFDLMTGDLYVADGGTDSTDTLYTLDTASGVLTPVGTTIANGLAGLEFIPEPNSLALTALGVAVVLRRRRLAN